MKRLIVVLVGSAALALPLMSVAQDVETYLNVEKAKAEVSACNKLLDSSTNENWWPEERTREMFWEWFDVEFHSMVIDPYEDRIKKERL